MPGISIVGRFSARAGARRYLGRVRMQSVLAYIKTQPLSPRERIRLLSGSASRISRTAEAHQTLRKAVKELISQEDALLDFSEAELSMLAEFAGHDEELKRYILICLLKAAL